MVKTPKTHHSGRHREPATIDLEAQPVEIAAEPDAKPEQPAGSVQAEAAVGGNEADAVTATSAGDAADPAGVAEPRREEKTDRRETTGEAKSTTADFGRSRPDTAPAQDRTAAKPQATATSSRGGISVLAAGLIGGLVALAGAGALQYAGVLPAPSRDADTSQAAEIAALRGEVDALRSGPAVPATDPALQAAVDDLRGRIAPLEQARSDAPQTDTLDARLQALETTVSDLARREGGDPAAIAVLSEKVSALESASNTAGEARASAEQKLAALEQTVAGLGSRVDAQAAQPKIAMAIASAALKSAIERGVPFTAEIETFAAIAPNAPELEGLRKLAESGVSTRPALEEQMDAAAAAMIAAGKPVDPNASYLNRLISSAESLVTIRPTGAVDGTGVPEIVARMEAAVKDGDYGRALAEYDALPEAPKAAGAEFAAKLRARLDAEKLVDQAIAGAMQAG